MLLLSFLYLKNDRRSCPRRWGKRRNKNSPLNSSHRGMRTNTGWKSVSCCFTFELLLQTEEVRMDLLSVSQSLVCLFVYWSEEQGEVWALGVIRSLIQEVFRCFGRGMGCRNLAVVILASQQALDLSLIKANLIKHTLHSLALSALRRFCPALHQRRSHLASFMAALHSHGVSQCLCLLI